MTDIILYSFEIVIKFYKKQVRQVENNVESKCKNTRCSQQNSCSKDQNDSACMLAKNNEFNHIKNVIGVVSGKGGVGKSLITAMLAVDAARNGYAAAILDADITGPSIPKMFGINTRAETSESGIRPAITKTGIKLMSMNLLLDTDDAPVVWRGPMIAGVVKQFWSDVLWGDIDYMFVDMPPGTGDVPLTAYQSLPVSGIVIVATPQDLVHMIVRKAFNMAKMMEIPILGLVENMGSIICPDCGKEISIFGENKSNDAAGEFGIPVLGRLPIDPDLAMRCDAGKIEDHTKTYLEEASIIIESVFPADEN